jgi:hypothetical protein
MQVPSSRSKDAASKSSRNSFAALPFERALGMLQTASDLGRLSIGAINIGLDFGYRDRATGQA